MDIQRQQREELGKALDTEFHCGDCNKVVKIRKGSRCLECGIWFCKKCALKHYEVDDE